MPRSAGLSRPSGRSSARSSGPSYGRSGGGGRRNSASTSGNARSGRNGASSSRRQRQQQQDESQDEMEEDEQEEEDEEEDGGAAVEEEEEDDGQDGDQDLRVKKRVRLAVSEGVKKLVSNLGHREIERRTNDLVRLALFSEQRRIPIRRDDISKKVLGKEAARAFPHIFNQAQKTLRNTFCYEMVELRARGAENEQLRTQAAGTSTQAEGRDDAANKANASKTWVLRSILPTPVITSMAEHDEDLAEAMADNGENNDDDDDEAGPSSRAATSSRAPQGSGSMLDWNKADGQLGSMGLTFLILSLILLNGRSLPDDQFRALLHRLGLQKSKQLPETLRPDSTMPLGGGQSSQRGHGGRNSDVAATDTTARPSSLQKFLDQLLKQQYLEITSDVVGRGTTQQQNTQRRGRRSAEGANGGSDERIEWRWGPRAEVEIGEVAVADFVSAVYVDAAGEQADGDEADESTAAAEASQAPRRGRNGGTAGATGRSGRSQTSRATQQSQRDKQTQALRREIERAAGSQLIA